MEIGDTNKEAMQYVELGKVSFGVFGCYLEPDIITVTIT